MDVQKVIEKTYAAWLGKIIGIRLGAPVEGWTAQEIKETYGKVTGYLVDYGTFAADDDSNGPLFFVRALQEGNKEISAKQMGDNVLNWLCDGHGFFWWGGVGIATEHTAYENLKQGIPAPQSGSVQVLGKALAEQIGGQIFSDCWGYVAFNDPALARDLAQKMSSVTHDLDGIQGGIFVAVAIALAYSLTSTREIVKEALNYLDQNSSYAALCKEIIKQVDDHPHQPESVLHYIQTHHGYDKYPGICHILPNTAIMIWALLYGNNDFDTTMTMLCEAGWDTDCTLGNVGSIMGAMLGLEGIADKWVKPIQDVLLASSCIGSENIDTVSRTALMFAELGLKLKNQELPEEYTTSKHITQFVLPRSTGGFRTNAHRYFEANLINCDKKLKVIINNAYPKTKGKVFQRTYYSPKDVYDSRYEPSFSPTVYPKEMLRFTISNPLKLDAQFSVYVQDEEGMIIESERVSVSKESTVLSLQLPAGRYLVCEAGVLVHIQKRMMRQYFFIEQMEIIPTYHFAMDFTKQSMEDWGIDFGDKKRQEVKQGVSHHGFSKTDDKGLHLNGMVTFGDYHGQVKEIEIDFAAPIQGSLEILFDVQGFMKYKAIRIGQKHIEYVKKMEGLTKIGDFACEIGSNSKITLKIDRKHALIKVVFEEGFCEFFDEEIVMGKGAVGLLCDDSSSCTILGCKLEGSNFQ